MRAGVLALFMTVAALSVARAEGPGTSVDVLAARAKALCAKAPCPASASALVVQAQAAVGQARARLAAGDAKGAARAVSVGDAAMILAELVMRRGELATDIARAQARTQAALARAAASEKAVIRSGEGGASIDARPVAPPPDAGAPAP